MRMETKTMRRGTPASKTLRVVKARTREGGGSRASGGRRITLPHASIANNMSSLSCPICAPQISADDADFLYYPSDEEIPVSLCKHVYGYPRDLKSKYTFLEDLGRGSFGVVRRVVDTETGSFHACKTIPKSRPTWTGGMDGAQREATTSAYLIKIQQEVNFLARLADVDEVVQLRRAYEDDECVHLVMDLCEGGSLADRMKSSGKGGDEEGARAAMR
uniref:Protein kinase domain-containing protein n=2 Tax=Chloropicon roscoffensis TaxID=1461544 RepID=A0A7S3FQZ4_9CHLO|mmetsp:Transcript_7632/g.22853  ORF Transcript_7632/g.22853 Transcript_7632/m.22853 type:complete len:218 (+) Transcript_7632:99-752(+)